MSDDEVYTPEYLVRGHAQLESYLSYNARWIEVNFNPLMERFEETVEMADDLDLPWDQVFDLLKHDL